MSEIIEPQNTTLKPTQGTTLEAMQAQSSGVFERITDFLHTRRGRIMGGMAAALTLGSAGYRTAEARAADNNVAITADQDPNNPNNDQISMVNNSDNCVRLNAVYATSFGPAQYNFNISAHITSGYAVPNSLEGDQVTLNDYDCNDTSNTTPKAAQAQYTFAKGNYTYDLNQPPGGATTGTTTETTTETTTTSTTPTQTTPTTPTETTPQPTYTETPPPAVPTPPAPSAPTPPQAALAYDAALPRAVKSAGRANYHWRVQGFNAQSGLFTVSSLPSGATIALRGHHSERTLTRTLSQAEFARGANIDYTLRVPRSTKVGRQVCSVMKLEALDAAGNVETSESEEVCARVAHALPRTIHRRHPHISYRLLNSPIVPAFDTYSQYEIKGTSDTTAKRVAVSMTASSFATSYSPEKWTDNLDPNVVNEHSFPMLVPNPHNAHDQDMSLFIEVAKNNRELAFKKYFLSLPPSN